MWCKQRLRERDEEKRESGRELELEGRDCCAGLYLSTRHNILVPYFRKRACYINKATVVLQA